MSQSAIDRLADLVVDPVFWVATVACGLFVTVVGNYATRFADRSFGAYRTRQLRRKGNVEASVQAAADHLVQHPNERFDLKLDILFYSQKSILYGVVTVACLVLTVVGLNMWPTGKYVTVACLVLALVAWFLVALYFQRERRARRVLSTYYQLSNIKTYDAVLDESVVASK